MTSWVCIGKKGLSTIFNSSHEVFSLAILRMSIWCSDLHHKSPWFQICTHIAERELFSAIHAYSNNMIARFCLSSSLDLLITGEDITFTARRPTWPKLDLSPRRPQKKDFLCSVLTGKNQKCPSAGVHKSSKHDSHNLCKVLEDASQWDKGCSIPLWTIQSNEHPPHKSW